MDANDCILTIYVSYNENSFTMQSDKIITIDDIKEKAIQHLNAKKEVKNYMKFIFKNNEKEVVINSDDDLILNADNSDIDNPKLNLNLLIEQKKEENEEKENKEEKEKGKNEEKENKEPNIHHENITSNEQNKNNDIKKINNITPTPTSTPTGDDDKYDELKKLIENLKNEIKSLKDEQINQTK